MKKILFLLPMMFMLSLNAASAGNFVSGSTGIDGAFNPAVDTQLQLPPNGILNFTTVNIPAGITVTFIKNAANTPVYILAAGDVNIAGTMDVSGTSPIGIDPGLGGPGGFDGGYGGIAGLGGGGGWGKGPGGGSAGEISGSLWRASGGGGSFASAGSGGLYAGSLYGNDRLIPLIGGSGGGGSAVQFWDIASAGGGGGGGALLIASSGVIKVTGTIKANGGVNAGSYHYAVSYYPDFSGGGSGGAIRLIANTINGSGVIQASGSADYWNPYIGGAGRIRLESFYFNFTSVTSPSYTYGLPGSVFVANVPSLSITSIAGVNVPSNPTASYIAPDMALPNTTTNPVSVALTASNIPLSATITVSAIPQFGVATNVTTTLSGTDASSTATASVNLSTDIASVIIAYTTYTLQTAMYWEGEKINKVKVASSIGKGSSAVYITESGKEIPATLLAGLIK